jgi:hypothetical protein
MRKVADVCHLTNESAEEQSITSVFIKKGFSGSVQTSREKLRSDSIVGLRCFAADGVICKVGLPAHILFLRCGGFSLGA